jgi:hypothetical protein
MTMPDATRRVFLSVFLNPDLHIESKVSHQQLNQVLVTSSEAQSLEPWDGIPFTAQSGVSVVPLGFEVYQPLSIQSWENAFPSARLVALKASGFDHLRITFDPTPALAAPTPFALEAILAVAAHAIEATLLVGLKVILDLHVAVTGSWSTALIEADFPNGPKWQRYLVVARAFGMLCGRYTPSTVALELYNENANNEAYGNSNWAIRIQALWRSVRSINLKTTLLVGGSFYSSIEGLQDLKASDFDKNTGFVVHDYEPTIFTHQNAAGYTRYVERLHYPPILSDRGAAITSMEQRIAASTLSDADKKRARSDRESRLRAYFDMPQDYDYLSAKIRQIVHWQARNNVPSSRIFITEFGSHNDRDYRGASLTARIAWTQDSDRLHEEAGFCRTIWNYNSPDYWDITPEDGSWRVRNGFLIALGRQPAEVYEPEAASLFRSFGGRPSTSRRALMSEAIRQLKDEGLWDKLDVLHVFAAENESEALIDWKHGGKADLSGAKLTFVRQQGLTNRFGQAGALQLGLSDARNLPHNVYNNHFGLFLVGNPNTSLISIDSVGDDKLLSLDRFSTLIMGGYRALHTKDVNRSELHVLTTRIQSVTETRYVNGSVLATEKPSAEVVEFPIKINFNASNASSCVIFHAGSDLDSGEVKNIYTILRFYLNGYRRLKYE